MVYMRERSATASLWTLCVLLSFLLLSSCSETTEKAVAREAKSAEAKADRKELRATSPSAAFEAGLAAGVERLGDARDTARLAIEAALSGEGRAARSSPPASGGSVSRPEARPAAPGASAAATGAAPKSVAETGAPAAGPGRVEGQTPAGRPTRVEGQTPAGGQTPPEGQTRAGAQAISVQAVSVARDSLVADRNTAGVVTPAVTSQVAAMTSGYVLRLLKRSGDWVAKGDIVVKLDDSLLRLALENARNALETAKINLATVQETSSLANSRLQLQLLSAQSAYNSAQKSYESQKALYALGGITASALDQASSQLSTAQANLESAKTAVEQNRRGLATTPSQNVEALKMSVTTAETSVQQALINLSNSSIRAPFAGQISAINVAPGMYVGQNSSVFVLVSSERQVNFGVPPTDAPVLQPGTLVSFEAQGKGYSLAVKLAPSAPVSGLVPLVAGAKERLDLPFGIVGSVSYRVALGKGVILPVAALRIQEDRNYVFTVEGGAAAIRYVKIVAEAGASVAVEGIEEGSVVVVNAPPGLLAGTAVRPILERAEKGPGSP
jgi:multidrug efflux pump subunit AcrA (membrane-fusion protein)